MIKATETGVLVEEPEESLPAPVEEALKEVGRPRIEVVDYHTIDEEPEAVEEKTETPEKDAVTEDGYSSKVDDAVNEIDALLREELNY